MHVLQIPKIKNTSPDSYLQHFAILHFALFQQKYYNTKSNHYQYHPKSAKMYHGSNE